MSEDEAVCVSGALQSIKKLDARRSRINVQGVQALSAAVKHVATPVLF